MKIGDYVRTIKGFGKVEKIEILKKDTIIYLDSGITIDYITKDFTKDELNKMYPSSPNIIDLIQPLDLLFVDISPDDCGGIVVPRIPETISELNNFKERIKKGYWVLKSILTKEQIESMKYRLGGI